MTTLKSIRERIVSRLQRGEDTSDLQDELAREKLKAAADEELPKLKAVADQRQEWQRQADTLKGRVAESEANIDNFLKVVDTAVVPLTEAVGRSRAIMEAERLVLVEGEGFHDIGQFAAACRGIPASYLPENLSCPFVVVGDGKASARDAGARAAWHMQEALALLASLKKQSVSFPPGRSVDDEVL